jgi:YegS/Rv2252/BmrU family lipid kinase
MPKVAVVAHARKSVGGGLEELRRCLAERGVSNPTWSEVPKSRYAAERVEAAVKDGAELVFVWGGDGMVQRTIDVLAGTGVPLAIVPAGTANLFATSLDVPQDVAEAVEIGLSGHERSLDVGKLNGERFAVMAGAGLDARIIKDADGGLKDRFGRIAYVWTASKHLRGDPFKARIEVNGDLWYRGNASCILLGNIGSLFAGVDVFDDAYPDDGVLELGVSNAEGLGEWARTIAHTVMGSATKSPFVQATKVERVVVELDRKVPYELDGGERGTVKRLKVKIEPQAITVRVPVESKSNGSSKTEAGTDG